MKQMSRFAVAATLSLMAAAPLMADPPMPRYAVLHITCAGTEGTCFEYQGTNGPITIGGTLISIEDDENRGCKPAEVPTRAIFLFQPGSSVNGSGYIGINACVNPIERTACIDIGVSPIVYDNVFDWRNAAGLH